QTYTPSTVTFDLSDTETVASAAEEIVKCHGHVDILINNAGISYRGTILDTAVDVDKEVMDINYFGPIALTKAALSPAILPSMVQRRSGHIVVISSVQGKIAIPFRSASGAVSPGAQRRVSVPLIVPAVVSVSVLDKNTAEGRDPRDVADAILKAVGRKKQDVLMAGLLPTVAVYMRTLCPALFFKFMAARARKERKAKDNYRSANGARKLPGFKPFEISLLLVKRPR
ncbi:DRS7B reductase, partial [Amia calva]|nr:DRS7B reductase [Amia calva]